jgi:PAS domain S-box-containing protein
MPALTRTELGPVKILLVDDEPKNLLALDAVLAGEGRTLRHASSGPEALMYLLEEDFAVILLDVNMPGMDGFETAALVRDREKSRDTPIIFLTAAIKGEAYVARGYSLSAVDYIFKPFEPEILKSKVAVFVQLFRKTQEVRQQAEALAASASFLNSVLDASTEYAIVAIDLEGNVVAWNEGAHRMYGYDAQQIVDKQHLSLVFPRDEPGPRQLAELLERAYASGKADGVFELTRRNGERFSGSMVVDLRRDVEGSDIGYVVITQDITERLHAERERLHLVEVEAAHAEAKVARGRFAFLAEASSLLTASLDTDLTLAALTRFVIPVLANICVVDLIEDESQEVRRVAVAGPASMRGELADELRTSVPSLSATSGVGHVLMRGVPVLHAEIGEEHLPELDVAPRAQATLRELAPVSAIIVPLNTRGKTLGAMTLLLTDDGRRYDDADLALAGDLADRAALALDNAWLYGEAQRAIRMRDDFLSFASHDLKNPLTAIKGTADVLEMRARTSVDPEAMRSVELLGRISLTATRMAGLVDQILDVAQLRSGEQLQLHRQLTDLVVLTRRVVGDFQLNPSHVIEVHVAQHHLLGEWDAARIERVIANLVNNAIKYSPPGSHIAVALGRERGADGTWAVLNVRDEGVGIPEDELPRVFDRYYRGRNVVGKVQGTGIGLAGVRQIVEQHGGHVAVTSIEGGGTTVCVRFPLPAEVDQNGRPGAAAAAD